MPTDLSIKLKAQSIGEVFYALRFYIEITKSWTTIKLADQSEFN